MTDLPDLDAHRDPQTEQLLARRRIGWQLQWIRLDDIDWRTTSARQVRSDGVDNDRLERYREALDAGARFPAVLAWDRASQGGWVLLGGIHRAQAHEAAGREWLPAYCVADVAGDAYVLALEHNATHGDGLTTADRVRHAEQLVKLHGLNRAEACRIVGISAGALNKARAVNAGRARANRLGVDKLWGKLEAHSQARIHWASKDDAVFVEAVRTAVSCRLRTRGVDELAGLITAAGGAGPDALQAVEDFEAEHHPMSNGGGGHNVPAPARVRKAAMEALNVDVAEVAERCLPVDRAITAELLFRAGKHLVAIAAALNERAKETA